MTICPSDVTYRLIKASDHPKGAGLQPIYTFGRCSQRAAEDAMDFSDDPCPDVILCECLSRCHEAWVAERNGEIVGAATLAFEGARELPGAVLEGVFVTPGFRGKGIGIRLIELALERFYDLQRTPIRCMVMSETMFHTIGHLSMRRPELFREFIRVKPV